MSICLSAETQAVPLHKTRSHIEADWKQAVYKTQSCEDGKSFGSHSDMKAIKELSLKMLSLCSGTPVQKVSVAEEWMNEWPATSNTMLCIFLFLRGTAVVDSTNK